jgi:hypothetical protein
MIKRGGTTLKTGKIGEVNCLRQQVMMPGERMDINISGSVRMESLRERDTMRIHAHLATFMTPIRWLDSNWTDFVKKDNTTQATTSTQDLGFLGIGSYQESSRNVQSVFAQAFARVHNEWYKWPESTDIPVSSFDSALSINAVPLQSAWSRIRESSEPTSSSDYTVSSATSFDVRELARIQAQFRGAMKRDVTSNNRWMELIDQVWKGDGSREVDQVPIMLDQTEIGVNPRDMPASDGAGLGSWQSLYDFGVNHSIKGVVAPEHCILTTILVVRFPPIIEAMMPWATDNNDWYELVGDPEFLESQAPVEVQRKDVTAADSATTLGYLPAGWQWRCEHNVIGKEIDDRNSFAYSYAPLDFSSSKNARRIKNAFRSASLGHYLVDVYFDESSHQPIGTAKDSYYSGMLDHTRNVSNNNDEFPFQGKSL